MCASSFSVFIVITCEWTSLWKLLADCTSTIPNYCSADVFTGRLISSYNMVRFECLSTFVQCNHCTCIMTCGDAPQLHVERPGYTNPCRWQLCQTLGGIYLINSNYRGLDEEEEQFITSMQFTGSYYRCYTVLTVPAILRHLFCRQFGNTHFDSLAC